MDRAPSDPGRFGEAVSWFKNRVPMLKGAWEKLELRARRRAVTIEGVTNLDLIGDVLDALTEAMKKGEPLAKFRDRVGDKLAREWGTKDPTRIDLIFRNNVQTAYNAGRWKQMQEPAVRKSRPYGKLSVIFDSRTSDICSELGKREVILPLDSPWWRTHWPPLHHRCRTTVITLTEAQARRMGVTRGSPKVEADEGFGLAPDEGEWKPDLRGRPKPLVQVFRRRYKG